MNVRCPSTNWCSIFKTKLIVSDKKVDTTRAIRILETCLFFDKTICIVFKIKELKHGYHSSALKSPDNKKLSYFSACLSKALPKQSK